MNVSLAQAAAALNANARWQESIAENLASASIPGFKKEELAFSALQTGTFPAGGVNRAALLLPHALGAINFTAGERRFTGVKTDVALDGPGFLAVQLPDGSTGFTRDGEMQVSSSGQLVTKEGYPILGLAGPIQLDLNNPTELSISATGEVSQGSDVKGTLRAAEFANPQLLTPLSHGYFGANNPALESQDNTATSFHQHYLEGSNTTAAAEMAQLIAAMRIYEANQRVLQAHDDRMGRAISELSVS